MRIKGPWTVFLAMAGVAIFAAACGGEANPVAAQPAAPTATTLAATAAAPDTAGPSVASSSPDTVAFGFLDRIAVTFDEAIDAATFTVDDVIDLSGPNGPIVPATVSQITANEFEIAFAPQSAQGNYTLIIGPEITDSFGNLMNQDGDGVNGETYEDRYTTTISLSSAPPFDVHLDFGIGGSPVAVGHAAVFTNSVYSPAVGHGWLSGSIDSRDRGVPGDALRRDFHFTQLATFAVDVPAAGAYDVTVSMGDGLAMVET